MKIGIDASRISLEQKTGTEWYSYYIIKNLLDIDQKNQYFLFSREKLPAEFLKYKNVQNIVLKWPLKKFWTLNKLSLSLKNYDLDLFFSPAHNLPLTKIKKVITWHDCGYEYFPDHYSRTQLLSLKMGARALKKADYIISPSLNTKDDIIKFYGIGEDKIFVIPHGIDFEKYKQTDINEEVRNKYGIKKDYILYIGRLESRKNIVNLIKSFESLRDKNKDFQLVLVGKASLGFREIKDQIEESAYKEDIKIIGWINEKDKISLLKKAKLFCLISLFEGFGMPLLEAMLCQVPVLVSNLDVFRELGLADICFTENNIGSISSKMENLLSEEEVRDKLIKKNLEAVQNFDWQKSAQETLEVFKRLV
jgi:glycosyltransferase involved in cell wall biosynthesis